MTKEPTQGLLVVHSAPIALRPHIEWSVNGVLGAPAKWRWKPVVGSDSLAKVSLAWDGAAGTAARIATALGGWTDLRFEVDEEGTRRRASRIFMHTPSLGIFTAERDDAGSILVSEMVIHAILDNARQNSWDIREALERALGKPWDTELELFRQHKDTENVSWLNAVGS